MKNGTNQVMKQLRLYQKHQNYFLENTFGCYNDLQENSKLK